MAAWEIAVGVAILLALVATALWGIYGDKWFRKEAAQESAPPPEKKEPVFSPGAQQDLPLDFTEPVLPELEESWQADYCYMVRFYEEQVREVGRFAVLQERLAQREVRLYRLLGFDETAQQWTVAESSTAFRYWTMMLPLANRSGSLSRERMKLLEDDCRRFAEKAGMRVMFSPLAGALERAKLLDAFCNEVDRFLQLRVVLAEPLELADVEELLQRGYMVADGKRHIYHLDSEVMFIAEPVLLPNNKVREVIFTLDAPCVSQPGRAFEDMMQRMEEIVELKQGRIFHGEREVGETEIGMMRGEAANVAAKMKEKGVLPGSTLAHLLFS